MKKIRTFEDTCYRKVLKSSIQRTKNTELLQSLNISENWLINSITSEKLKHSLQRKEDGKVSFLEERKMGSVVPVGKEDGKYGF